MSDKNIELTRRRVLGGIATVGAASAAVGAGTFAAFSDTETSSGNTISAGTLDLESPSATNFALTSFNPGSQETASVSTTYSNDSTLDAEVSLSLSLSEADNEPTEPSVDNEKELTADEFAQKVKVNSASISDGSTSYDFPDLSETTTGHPPDGNGGTQSYIDLKELEGEYNSILSDVSPGDSIDLSLTLSMPTKVGNEAQADGVNVGVTFTADQQT